MACFLREPGGEFCVVASGGRNRGRRRRPQSEYGHCRSLSWELRQSPTAPRTTGRRSLALFRKPKEFHPASQLGDEHALQVARLVPSRAKEHLFSSG
jgi:hypothetical protein